MSPSHRPSDIRSARDVDAVRERLVRQGYRDHGGELYRFACRRLADDGLAQDAVQETVVRAWRAADRFDPALGSLRSWLYAILHNVINDLAAARRRQPSPTDPSTDLDTGVPGATRGERAVPDRPGGIADGVVNRDLVVRALQMLTPDQRTAIVETYLRDRPYAEVAEELGVPLSTLRSRVFYGLKQLRLAMTTMEVG